VGGCGLDLSCSGPGPVAVSCERGNETSDSIKVGQFLEFLRDSEILAKDFSQWS
jgi:hypothetical protein